MANDKPQQHGADPLTGWLREARENRPLPPGFQRAVWQRIAKTTVPQSSPILMWLDALADRLLRPKLALAGVAAVLLAGVIAGVQTGMTDANQAARARYLSTVAPASLR